MRRHARFGHRSRSVASCCEKSKRCGRDGEWSSFAANARWLRLAGITQLWLRLAACFPATSGTFRSRYGNCRRSRERSRKSARTVAGRVGRSVCRAVARRNAGAWRPKIIVRTVSDRDLTFIKLLAQRLTRQSAEAVAFLGTTSDQPALVFAQSAGPAVRYGSAYERSSCATGRTRRRKQRHGAGRPCAD